MNHLNKNLTTTNQLKTALVFDTDVGTDDAFGLLILSQIVKKSPDFIIATEGNTSLNGAIRNLFLLKKYLGIDFQAVQGKPFPQNKFVNRTEKNTFHGDDGLANTTELLAKETGITDDDLKDIISFNELKKRLADFDHIDYIAVGPLSNLSNLIKDDKLKQKLRKIYVMGGGLRVFNCSHDTEFNFSKDPESVKNILNSGLDITIFPLDITNHQWVTSYELKKLESFQTYTHFITFLKYNMQSNRQYNKMDAAVLHDAIPVLYYAHPSRFIVKDKNLICNQYGHIEEAENGAPVHVALYVLRDLLTDTLEHIFRIKSK